jgi:hypothetical protein
MCDNPNCSHCAGDTVNIEAKRLFVKIFDMIKGDAERMDKNILGSALTKALAMTAGHLIGAATPHAQSEIIAQFLMVLKQTLEEARASNPAPAEPTPQAPTSTVH